MRDSVSTAEHDPLIMQVPEHGIHYLELVATDPQATRDFYAAAFGLTFSAATPELGGAYFATLPTGSLLGIRGSMHAMETPVVRNYLRVDDVRAAVEQAEALGATIALGPTEIAGRGEIAIYLIGGIEQGVWQLP